MKVNFLTSGFPDGFSEEFIREITKFLKSSDTFVFVASDFSGHEKSKRYMNGILQMFREKGIRFEHTFLVDFEITPEDAKKYIREADVVWLSGGPTLTQIRHIQKYGLTEALRGRDGITIGMSAGSINMAKRVVLARDPDDDIPALAIYDGIGLVDCNIEPHLNQAKSQHIQDIQEAAQYAPIYGLYDGSFIVEVDGETNIFGSWELFAQ